MEEWKEYKLGEVVIPVKDRIETSCLDSTSYISTENMLPDKAGVTLSSGVPSGNAVMFKNDDILISNIRPYFKKIWRANRDGGCSADVICLRASNAVDPLFLYYLLSQDLFFDYVMQGAKGTKMPRGDRNQIMQWPVLIPSKNEQHIIASILSALDDKIEVNRRINDNLEQQAQALFKSWFVDFEPFRDQPFVESELGMIPEGWRVGTLGDYVETTSGGTPSRKIKNYYEGGNICWVKSKELANGFITETEEQISDIAVKQSAAKVLPKHSVLIAMYGATVGEYGIISQPMTCNQAICALLPNNKVPYSILYMLAKNNKENLQSKAIGSAQQNVSQAIIKRLKIKYNTEVFCDFNCIIEPMLKRIEATTIESRRLAELRDTLLPRLMSGEIKVGDVTL